MTDQKSRARLLRATEFFEERHEIICSKLEELDAKERFTDETWSYAGGGGGRIRVLRNRALFEEAGVNTPAVSGQPTEGLAQRMNVPPQSFSAAGISPVIHPLSPMIPAVHANFRCLELRSNDAWFGGGSDLRPTDRSNRSSCRFHRSRAGTVMANQSPVHQKTECLVCRETLRIGQADSRSVHFLHFKF